MAARAGADLDEIIEIFGPDSERPNTGPVDREKVLRWFASDEIEVLGAAYAFITDKRHLSRIRPSLQVGAIRPFVRRYLDRCLRDNPEGDWSDPRYLAGHAIVAWFDAWWDGKGVVPADIEEWKRSLESMYKGGEDDLRLAIETAVLEHLFERKAIALYFADWRADPELNGAYERALDWGMHHRR
jgi:hypothetical protein